MSSYKPKIAPQILELLIHLLEDAACIFDSRSTSIGKDIASLRAGVEHHGWEYLTVHLPSLGKALDRAISGDYQPVIPPLFPAVRYGSIQIPAFMQFWWKLVFDVHGRVKDGDMICSDGRMIRPLREALCRKRLTTDCRLGASELQIYAVRTIRQICFLAYKLDVPYPKELRAAKVQEFLSTDDSLPCELSVDRLSSVTRRALENANLLISYVTRRLDTREIHPKHGPGAVATKERGLRKFVFRRFYPSLEKFWPYAEYFFFNYSHLADELETLETMNIEDLPTSKMQLVPKDSRGPRLICMEPLEIQWIQQGLAGELLKCIEHPRSPTFGYVNFDCQEVNRDLARLSSVGHGHYSDMVTLDLKDASDRVSLALVKQLFPPHLYEALLACRSGRTVVPRVGRRELKKFASMGSALCFPVESLIFWALAVGSLVDVLSVKDLSFLPTVYVFGDDLIVRKCDYDRFSAVFEELNLQFNKDKCCIGRFFRESCGFDAFKGKNVTPVRLHTPWPLKKWSPKALLSYVEYANAFISGERDYPSAHEYVRGEIFEHFGPLPILAKDATFTLAFKQACSRAEQVKSLLPFRRRYNRRLCRTEFKVPVTKPLIKKISTDSEWAGYWMAHTRRVRFADPFGFEQDPLPVGQEPVLGAVKLQWTWTAGYRLIEDYDRVTNP